MLTLKDTTTSNLENNCLDCGAVKDVLGSRVKYNCTKETQNNCRRPPKKDTNSLLIALCVVGAILIVAVPVVVVFVIRASRRRRSAYSTVCHASTHITVLLWQHNQTTREQLPQTDY